MGQLAVEQPPTKVPEGGEQSSDDGGRQRRPSDVAQPMRLQLEQDQRAGEAREQEVAMTVGRLHAACSHGRAMFHATAAPTVRRDPQPRRVINLRAFSVQS